MPAKSLAHLRLPVLGVLLVLATACAPIIRSEGVTTADVPAGASKFATETKLEIIETFTDATDKADPAEIDNYKSIAVAAVRARLALDKLELVAPDAEAPLKMLLEIQIRRWEPITGGGSYIKAIVSNAKGKQLFTTNTAAPLDLILNGLDTKVALRDASERLGRGIIDGLTPLLTPTP